MFFIKKTSVQWLYESNYIIIDAIGWDKSRYDYSFYFEKITEAEFKRRIKKSVVELKDEKK